MTKSSRRQESFTACCIFIRSACGEPSTVGRTKLLVDPRLGGSKPLDPNRGLVLFKPAFKISPPGPFKLRSGADGPDEDEAGPECAVTILAPPALDAAALEAESPSSPSSSARSETSVCTTCHTGSAGRVAKLPSSVLYA